MIQNRVLAAQTKALQLFKDSPKLRHKGVAMTFNNTEVSLLSGGKFPAHVIHFIFISDWRALRTRNVCALEEIGISNDLTNTNLFKKGKVQALDSRHLSWRKPP